MTWETVIGLEVHVQLDTKSKIFCGSSTAFGALPNTQTCPVDLALPGTLPVLNEEAAHMAVKLGLAINAHINQRSIFARKNYFYPDLPKGYQITQFDIPIVGIGHLDIVLEDDTIKRIGVTRAHLEEDAGKSLHEDFSGLSGIDLNRAGVPLLEVVSEPDMRSAKEAIAYLKTLHSLVRYLEICDGNMQEGSFRCDANVSVRKKGETKFGTRVEIKNVNSFRFVERAINFEVERQIEVITAGGSIAQETRLYDSDKNETRAMRSKEDAHDYRYFADPDLLPVVISDDFIDMVRKTLPELPALKRQRFIEQYGLSSYDASVLTSARELAVYFEIVVQHADGHAKIAANWVSGELLAALNKDNIDITESPISASELGILVARIKDNTISGKIAKQIFETMWATPNQSVDAIIDKEGLRQVTDTGAIETLVDEIIANNPGQVSEYRAGKDKLFGFFVGQAMKLSQGKANPEQLNEVLKRKL